MTDAIRDLLISLAGHMAYMQGQLEESRVLEDPEDYYWYRESVLLRQKVTDALADEPAVPECREPASVTGQPSDQQLLEVMPQQFHDDLATVSRMAAHGAGPDVGPGLFRVSLNTGVVDFARAVLARWGNPSPQPPAEPTVPTVMEIIELSYEIEAAGLGQVDLVRAALTRWGNPAPQPPAEGGVAELAAKLRRLAPHNPLGTADPTITRAAELLQRQTLVPVRVSERLPGASDCAPWPKDSDASAWCWVGTDEDGGWNWEQRSAGCLVMFPDDFTHWLPAHALPIPQQ